MILKQGMSVSSESSAINRSMWILVGVWFAANILNALTTWVGLGSGFVEISPVPKWMLMNGGPVAMWGLKLVAALLLPMVLRRGALHGFFSKEGVHMGMVLACIPVLTTVVWEAALLIFCPPLAE